MYRIIGSGKDETVYTGKKASGSFGSNRALHRTPKRYKYIDKAIGKAMKMPGAFVIMDDNRAIGAVVKNGKLLAQHMFDTTKKDQERGKVLGILEMLQALQAA